MCSCLIPHCQPLHATPQSGAARHSRAFSPAAAPLPLSGSLLRLTLKDAVRGACNHIVQLIAHATALADKADLRVCGIGTGQRSAVSRHLR